MNMSLYCLLITLLAITNLVYGYPNPDCNGVSNSLGNKPSYDCCSKDNGVLCGNEKYNI